MKTKKQNSQSNFYSVITHFLNAEHGYRS